MNISQSLLNHIHKSYIFLCQLSRLAYEHCAWQLLWSEQCKVQNWLNWAILAPLNFFWSGEGAERLFYKLNWGDKCFMGERTWHVSTISKKYDFSYSKNICNFPQKRRLSGFWQDKSKSDKLGLHLVVSLPGHKTSDWKGGGERDKLLCSWRMIFEARPPEIFRNALVSIFPCSLACICLK